MQVVELTPTVYDSLFRTLATTDVFFNYKTLHRNELDLPLRAYNSQLPEGGLLERLEIGLYFNKKNTPQICLIEFYSRNEAMIQSGLKLI